MSTSKDLTALLATLDADIATHRTIARFLDLGGPATATDRALKCAKLLAEERATMLAALREAHSHLSAVLAQAIPSDDQIIIGHVRDAAKILVEAST